MTFLTPHTNYSRHGLFFTRLDCQSNGKPSEKDHDLPGIRTRDIRSSSQSITTTPFRGRRKYYKNKNQEKNNNIFFYLGSLKMDRPKKLIFNIFQT
jgi:hypothetical protein